MLGLKRPELRLQALGYGIKDFVNFFGTRNGTSKGQWDGWDR